MTYLILFMVIDEKSNTVQIINSITDFFSPDETTYNDIEGQEIVFCGNFIGDHLPSMVHVTDAAFKNLKVKAPSLIAIKQAINAGVLTNQTLMI